MSKPKKEFTKTTVVARVAATVAVSRTLVRRLIPALLTTSAKSATTASVARAWPVVTVTSNVLKP